VRTTDGLELAVFAEGAGERTALLVHGYPDTHRVWDQVAAALAGAGFRVVRYDVRGAGASQAPVSRDGYRLDQLADDLFAVIDEVGGPVHLVGHDWGSIQSWHAVTDSRAAGRILSFTSISGPSLDHAAAWFRRRLRRPTPRHLRQAATQAGKSWYIGVFQIPFVAETMVRRAFRSRSADAVRGLGLYRANIGSRRAPRFSTSVPVQVITPLRDRYVSGSLASEDVHRWVPGVTRRTVDAGHWSALSAAAPLIAEFASAASDPASLSRSLAPTASIEQAVGANDLNGRGHGLVVVTGGGRPRTP
jgi:pimeloyl-ACP methyl ester carboxylesterase